MSEDSASKSYMKRALELAEKGFGLVEPNPMVGCLIVKDEKIIGEGRHERFGGPHAEINAISDCKNKNADSKGGTMYVTLEPCCHHGKTGPCTKAIIEAGVSKVCVAMEDPSDKVAGEGIKELKEAEVEVEVGLCEKEAKALNPGFIKYSKTGLPWVILKWAQTLDGKLAGSSEDQRWITGEESLEDVHQLRRSCQGILVGVNTVVMDDPMLTPRPAMGKKVLRIVLDGEIELPLDCKLLKTSGENESWIITEEGIYEAKKEKVKEIEQRGVNVIVVPADADGFCDVEELLKILGKAGVQRLLVEGGVQVHHHFLDGGFGDEINIYIAPKIYAGEGTADIANAVTRLHESIELKNVQTKLLGDDYKVKAFLKDTE